MGIGGRSKDGKGENAMRSGITRRWLRGSLLITVLLVLLVEVMFLYSTTRSYYNGVQQTMYRRFSSITGQLKMYTGETSQKTAASRSVALRRMVEQFSDKDKYEFMLLDSYGGVIASSSGTDAEGIVTSTDFEQAQEAMDGQGVAIYRTQSGEMVMAACCLVPYAAEDVAAMRLVTSLTLVGQQLKRTAVVALIMGTAVLAFTIMSGLYFVRSIVVPLGQVERTAASIARGELDVRLPVTGDERDEVDRLRGTINRMAEGLEETEKMKNEFISSVSHELRTPLTSIRGWVETLRTLDDPSDENYRKGLEIINNETARLYNMVEELLDFSRLQNGRLKMTCRPLDLVAELTDAVLFCEARIQREGLVLVYNEPEEMIPVYADPDRRSAGGRKLVRLEDCSPDIPKLLPELRRIAPNLCVKNSPLFDVGETFRLFGPCRTEVVSLHDECKEVVVYTDGTGPLLTAVALELGEFSCTPAEARATPCDKPFDPAAYRWLLIPDVALQKARLTPTYLQGHADIWSPNGYGFAAEKSEDTLGRWLEIERIEPYNPKQLKRELSGSRLTILKQDFPLTAAEIAARLGIREGGERRIAFTKLGQDYWTIRLK